MCNICKPRGGKALRIFGHSACAGQNYSGEKRGSRWGESCKDKFCSAFKFTLLPQGQQHLLYGLYTYIKFLFLCVLYYVVNTAIKPEAPRWEQSINSLKEKSLH